MYGCGVLLNYAPGANGWRQLTAPVSGCFQCANAFGYHPAISQDSCGSLYNLTVRTDFKHGKCGWTSDLLLPGFPDWRTV